MRHRKTSLAVVAALVAIALSATYQTSTAQSGQPAAIDFARDIEPIILNNCVKCHGPQRAMAGLRLDQDQGLLQVVAPRNSRDSRLVKRILGEGEEKRMPLGAPPLAPSEIAIIRRWIDTGAILPPRTADQARHWSYIAPIRPTVPQTKNTTWARNPIDNFVLARLEKEGISPSPIADRSTLLRRIGLDLVGLPPSISETDAFLGDNSLRAFEKQIDRLLASSHFGERWARRWLDAARYADSDGYEKDKQRQVWFYRDWVIDAINSDKPYNQFIVEQIAGDRLPGATQQQIVATGFLRNSMVNEEGGIDPEQFRMEAMFDRMDAIGKSVLGLTIQCAQCHNHKFDPLRQEEYYRLFAFLNNSDEAQLAVYTPAEEMKRAEIFRRIREIEADLQHRTPDWEARQAKWEEAVANNDRAGQQDWIVLKPTVVDMSTGGQRYIPIEDGSFLAQGYAPTKHRAKFVVRTDQPRITGFRLELMVDANLPMGGPGRSPKGIGALTEFEAEAVPVDAPEKPVKLKFASATSSFEQAESDLEGIYDDRRATRRMTGSIRFAIDGIDETAWGIDAGPGQRNQTRQAVFVLDQPLINPGGTTLNLYLKQNHGGWNSNDNQNNNLGRVRLALTSASNPVADPIPAGVRQILAIPVGSRSAAQRAVIFSYWRTLVPEWRIANAEVGALWKTHPEGTSQLVLSERAQARSTTMLKRGNFLQPDRAVTSGVPAYLHPLSPDAGTDRLALARWLIDSRSPTTARVIVNRIWQEYFGTGLVSTPEDFGRQGERPTHPELLDWLAVELMENGWHLKHIHRLITTSATYRQASRVTPALLARDPDNRLLARGPRFRVEAEIVRDIALSVSGLLNEKVGGPSVYPPSPEFLYLPPASYGTKLWPEEKGEDRYRRAIYTFRYRSVPFPVFQVFDAPTADVSCVRRARSNTPLQALTALNETVFIEAARALALRTLQDGGPGDATRLVYAFRRVLTRTPTIEETRDLQGLLNRQ
ncbi:MAG: PSD1 and planctomycete cytochrome C domain-containing protein, partial [Acidobacteriota bacterium]